MTLTNFSVLSGAELLEAVDSLPAAQYLVVDVLQARLRLGETCWTFPGSVKRTVNALVEKGLVSVKSSPADSRALLVFPSAALRDALLSGDYVAPVFR